MNVRVLDPHSHYTILISFPEFKLQLNLFLSGHPGEWGPAGINSGHVPLMTFSRLDLLKRKCVAEGKKQFDRTSDHVLKLFILFKKVFCF
jgi:hypothetical protein